MKLLKPALYIGLFFLSLKSYAFDFYEGEAPYINANPTLSKVLAIEDALLKANYKKGGEFYSETLLKNQINFEEKVHLKSNQILSEVSLKSCEAHSSTMKCLVGFKYLKRSVFKPRGEMIRPCNGPSSSFQVCYKVSDQRSQRTNGTHLFKARLSLLVKNSGIVRFEESFSIYGLGETEDKALSSLSKQAELMAFNWSKNNFLLLESKNARHKDFLPFEIQKRKPSC